MMSETHGVFINSGGGREFIGCLFANANACINLLFLAVE